MNFGKRLGSNTSGSKNYDGYAWIKFYDGSQTVADPWLVDNFTTGDYALNSNFIGTGNAYAIVTYKTKNDLWQGFPKALFIVNGIELLNAATGLASTTHDNPVDFIYTVMRGLEYDGEWFYGSQKIQPSQLAGGDWGVQRQKCIDANYTLGGDITVATSALDAVSEALASCGGRMAESGGQFRMLAVEPDASVASFVDADIISTESQSFTTVHRSQQCSKRYICGLSVARRWLAKSNCSAFNCRRSGDRGR